MKAAKPSRPRPSRPPKRKVNRSVLIRLIERHRRILKGQLAHLKSLTGETVDLRVTTAVVPWDSVAASATASNEAGEGTKLYAPRQKNPGELENSCVYFAGPADTDAEVIGTVTPYEIAGAQQK